MPWIHKWANDVQYRQVVNYLLSLNFAINLSYSQNGIGTNGFKVKVENGQFILYDSVVVKTKTWGISRCFVEYGKEMHLNMSS